MMSNSAHSILEYYAHIHSGYLHARGRRATDQLIKWLNCQPNEEVLEIGFGTAATLVQLSTKYPRTFFTGVDIAPTMLAAALKRLKFARTTNNVHLLILEIPGKLPFGDNTFDKVYAESILGIQEGSDFIQIFQEITRILRPNGMLVFNETIWLDTTVLPLAVRINTAGKQAFGIIQANSEYPHLKDWKRLMQEIGLETIAEMPVATIAPTPLYQRLQSVRILSELFTLLGKIKGFIRNDLRLINQQQQKQIKAIRLDNQPIMAGFLVKAINVKIHGQ